MLNSHRHRTWTLVAVMALALSAVVTLALAREVPDTVPGTHANSPQSQSQSQSQPPQPAQPKASPFTVFVDPPTGFVFVKLPRKWQFVGRIDQAQVHALQASRPAWVVTRLLATDDTAYAELRDGPKAP